MKKIAVVTNWVLLAFFGCGCVVIMLQHPRLNYLPCLLVLLPYATALSALKFAPNRALAGVGLFFNAWWVIGGVAGLVLAIIDPPFDQIAVICVVCPFMILPSSLNCLVLKRSWDQARANKSLQATRAELHAS